jgi:hypothetical protein
MTATFDEAIKGLRATGASVSTHEVVEAIERHGQEEGQLLDRYRRFAEEAESPVARYLVNMILDDERRHHRVLGELANTLAWGRVDGPVGVVPVHPETPSVEADLRAETKALLAHERKDRAELRRLRRQLRSWETPLWTLLIDMMVADTDKHIEMLRFVLRGAGRPRRRWLRLGLH